MRRRDVQLPPKGCGKKSLREERARTENSLGPALPPNLGSGQIWADRWSNGLWLASSESWSGYRDTLLVQHSLVSTYAQDSLNISFKLASDSRICSILIANATCARKI